MPSHRVTRRRFLKSTAATGTAAWVGTSGRAAAFHSPNQRPRIGVVGCACRWDKRVMDPKGRYGIGEAFTRFGDIVTVCDVDRRRLDAAAALVKSWLGSKPAEAVDYRKVINDPSIDVVHITTPDHWHAKIAIEAMLAGKDVYCEKPLTLTIEEGKLIGEVRRKTGAVFQVGTQQRSGRQFIQAVAMIRAGRLGKLKHVQCGIGGGPTSPAIPKATPPKHLDWNQWLGPAPQTPYLYQAGATNIVNAWTRGHYEFRWWYEYSGGKLTDWGAHHVDIATWGMDKTTTGPVTVDPVMVEHPVEFRDGYPVVDNRYNTATAFKIKATYDDGVELTIRHDTDNGILFEGTEGRIFVNRGRLTGKPVEELAGDPLPDGALQAVYKDRPLTDHVTNFFEAVAARREPISDVYSHHRALTTCHLAGIAARLGRTIHWDPGRERVVDDALAQSLVGRTPRAGFEIEM